MRLTILNPYNSYFFTILKSNLQFFSIPKSNQVLVYGERGKPEYPEKNLSEQSREPTNSVHLWRRVRESNPRHIGGMRALSALRQPCSPSFRVLSNFEDVFVLHVMFSDTVEDRKCQWTSFTASTFVYKQVITVPSYSSRSQATSHQKLTRFNS